MKTFNSEKEVIKQTDSKEPIRGYTPNSWSSTVIPEFSYDGVKELIYEDPVANGAIKHFVDKCMESNWTTLNRKSKKVNKVLNDELMFNFDFEESVMRPSFTQGKTFNGAFVEIVRKTDGSPKAYNVLDSTNIDPKTKPNGDLIKLRSKIPNPNTGEYAEWAAEDVVWIKFSGNNIGFPQVDLRSLWYVLNIKKNVLKFIQWLWQTGQYRVIHNFPASNTGKVIDDFIAYNRKNDADFTKPFLIEGDYANKMLRDMKEIENIDTLLKYLDSQILILIRVAPNDIGIPDSSGRSNADAQSNSFVTSVKSFKQTFSNAMIELFNKSGKSTNYFAFFASDKNEIKSVVETSIKLKGIGLSNEAILEFLNDNGLYFETKTVFEPVPDMEQGNNSQVVTNVTAPSRAGKDDGVANEKIGTGQNSSTRSDQLIKQTWTYDVIQEDDE